MSAVDLSVVLPVYNEALVLEATCARLIPSLEALLGPGRTFEIVCVDDGSTDGSRALLERPRAKEPRLVVEALPENRGKGAAVKAGVLAARGDRIFFMDVDLSTPLEEMAGFLGALDSGYDVVIGNRRAPGSRITRRQPRHILKNVIPVALPVQIRDPERVQDINVLPHPDDSVPAMAAPRCSDARKLAFRVDAQQRAFMQAQVRYESARGFTRAGPGHGEHVFFGF